MNEPAWTDGQCAEWVIRWATEEAARASSARLKADIDERCRKTAEDEWDRLNPDAGVGSFDTGNPYKKRGDYHDKEREKLALSETRWLAVRDFVTRRICACIDTANAKMSRMSAPSAGCRNTEMED